MNFARRTWLKLAALPLLCGAAQGCGGPTFVVQAYSGPPRPAGTIAVVRVNGTDRALLATLDGEDVSVRIAEDSRLHLEVLPGKHTLQIMDAQDLSRAPLSAPFLAEAGKVYRPMLLQTKNGALVGRVYQVDGDSDSPIRDVTLSLPAAPG